MLFEKYPFWAESLRLKLSELFHRYSLPKWIVLCHDITAVFLAFIIAYLLRFNFATQNFVYSEVLLHGLVALIIYTLLMLVFRSYTGLIRHTTLTDISLVFVSTTTAAFVLMITSLLLRLFTNNENLIVPVSIILIHYVLITVYLFFMRISVKVLFLFTTSTRSNPKKRVLIYGAGEMGFIVKRVISSDPRDGFIVIGFIDDNKMLQGKKINGIRVYNPDILDKDFPESNKIKTIIIAIRNIKARRKSDIIKKALDSNLEVLEAPAIEKWLNGHLEVHQLQKVNLLDLLGREPIRLNLELIKRELKGKTVMVTGSAGSIGSELIRQLSRFEIKNIILVDQAETPMFHLENELKQKFGNLKYEIQIADVTNYAKMNLIFSRFRPEVVFHAAAYKHVHLMEISPHEAFRVNVVGTKNVPTCLNYMVLRNLL
jgi:FlaA1/EpsC-like NDP-sugar epimerase